MADFTIKQNDRLPYLVAQLLDPDDAAINLTGTTVELRYRVKGTDTVIAKAAVITDAPNGWVRYEWDDTDTTTAGVRYAEWRIDYGSGLYMTVPNTGNFSIEVVEDIGNQEDSELLLSIEELKDIYLFGTDLTDNEGNPFPERMYERYINAAVAWLEKELDIPLEAVDIVDELHDHYANDYGRWGWFQLDKYPVISIAGVGFQYPTSTRVEIDLSWIVLEDEGQSGQLQIVPGQGNIADVLLIPGQLMPMWSGAFGRVPGIWRISYRAGFEIDALPADLKHAIAMHAAIGVFNVAGDLIAGAGIASMSISVPGLNQNVNTTSSATNSGYGARIIEYQKELKEMLPNLRRYYGKGTKMVVA